MLPRRSPFGLLNEYICSLRKQIYSQMFFVKLVSYIIFRTKYVFSDLREAIGDLGRYFPDLREAVGDLGWHFPESRGRVGDLGLQSVNRWQEIFHTKFVFFE